MFDRLTRALGQIILYLLYVPPPTPPTKRGVPTWASFQSSPLHSPPQSLPESSSFSLVLGGASAVISLTAVGSAKVSMKTLISLIQLGRIKFSYGFHSHYLATWQNYWRQLHLKDFRQQYPVSSLKIFTVLFSVQKVLQLLSKYCPALS